MLFIKHFYHVSGIDDWTNPRYEFNNKYKFKFILGLLLHLNCHLRNYLLNIMRANKTKVHTALSPMGFNMLYGQSRLIWWSCVCQLIYHIGLLITNVAIPLSVCQIMGLLYLLRLGNIELGWWWNSLIFADYTDLCNNNLWQIYIT